MPLINWTFPGIAWDELMTIETNKSKWLLWHDARAFEKAEPNLRKRPRSRFPKKKIMKRREKVMRKLISRTSLHLVHSFKIFHSYMIIILILIVVNHHAFHWKIFSIINNQIFVINLKYEIWSNHKLFILITILLLIRYW